MWTIGEYRMHLQQWGTIVIVVNTLLIWVVVDARRHDISPLWFSTGSHQLPDLSTELTWLRETRSSTAKQRYCGLKLMEKLSKVCNHCYRDESESEMSKRDDNTFDSESGTGHQTSHKRAHTSHERAYTSNRNPLVKRRLAAQKRKAKITDECCDKSCTKTQMITYCCKAVREANNV